MIALKPARKRPVDRTDTPSDKTPAAQSKTWPAPIDGWVSNTNLAAQDGSTAFVLENFWPTSTGIEPRGGLELRGTVTGEVTAMFYHSGSDEAFVADGTDIYAFPLGGTGAALSSVVSGQTSGDYVALEMQTDAGVFLTVVNGADDAQQYDGTTWAVPAITGVSTDLLSYVWAYRNRQFFIEAGTMNAWYLGINSIAGAATKLPLSGVFNRGGALLFGARWSTDGGDGLDDRIIFATSKGEFAVYSGDPADVNSWSLQGVYDLGEPLGATAHFSVGGDLIVATKEGLIPLSAAQAKGPSQLQLSALSRAIEPDWQEQALIYDTATPWGAVKWVDGNKALVYSPVSATGLFGVNLETTAWCLVTGWTPSVLGVLDGALYLGDTSGNVFQADTGGEDNGLPIICRCCYAFDHLGSPAAYKVAGMIKPTVRYVNLPNVKAEVASDYTVNFSTAPSAAAVSSTGTSAWDVSPWDTSPWGGLSTARQIDSKWRSITAEGFALAPVVQITSSGTTKLNCELVSVDMTYTSGAVGE